VEGVQWHPWTCREFQDPPDELYVR
jgi:hypothetical protein